MDIARRRTLLERATYVMGHTPLLNAVEGISLRLLIADLMGEVARAQDVLDHQDRMESQLALLTKEVLRLQELVTDLDLHQVVR